MLFLPFVTLFALSATAVPLESSPLSKHPSIDTLNSFSAQVSSLADEINGWNGQQNGVESIMRHGKEAIAMLHVAVTQMKETESIDYWNSGLGFAGAGLAVSGKAHNFAAAVMAKMTQLKAGQLQQPMFQLLDDAYTEATQFFVASKEKMPAFVYSLLKPFHTELLGTIAEAREAFRPSQEIVVVVVQGNTPGAPPTSYTLPPGAPIPTQFARPPPGPPAQDSPMPQYSPLPQYPQQAVQYSSRPTLNQYTPYTPRPTQASDSAKYTPYNARPQEAPYRTAASAPEPQTTGYAW
jgi:hypothetical protein